MTHWKVEKKTLFSLWTLERLLKEAIESPNINWLELVISFDLENKMDSHFDIPITRRSFVFHCFKPIATVPVPDARVDRALIDYYLAYSQPQYMTWSAQKITTVKVMKPVAVGGFIKVKFRVTRGSENTVPEISLADLPNLNPHEWILLTNFLLTEEQKYKPILTHLKRMLVSYIYEVSKLDTKFASALSEKPIVNPIGKASDLNKMRISKIDTEHWTVMLNKGNDASGSLMKCLFALTDKHLFSTSCFEHILDIINRCKYNDAAAKKSFNDMLLWYINFRRTILAIFPKAFNTIKKTQQAQH